MIRDPARRGRALAEFYRAVSPRLFRDLEESGTLPAAEAGARARRREEWECFALYACVRGLVAAGGFNRETGAAIDALHESVAAAWSEEGAPPPEVADRRARLAERYGEYGAIGQEGGAAGAATVSLRLGASAARHLTAPDPPDDALAEIAGALHESLAEGAAEAIRQAE